MAASDTLRGAFVEAAFTPGQVDASIAQDSRTGVRGCVFLDEDTGGAVPEVPVGQAGGPLDNGST